jgi:hypothetical protein
MLTDGSGPWTPTLRRKKPHCSVDYSRRAAATLLGAVTGKATLSIGKHKLKLQVTHTVEKCDV